MYNIGTKGTRQMKGWYKRPRIRKYMHVAWFKKVYSFTLTQYVNETL